jgi:hypothetical protein
MVIRARPGSGKIRKILTLGERKVRIKSMVGRITLQSKFGWRDDFEEGQIEVRVRLCSGPKWSQRASESALLKSLLVDGRNWCGGIVFVCKWSPLNTFYLKTITSTPCLGHVTFGFGHHPARSFLGLLHPDGEAVKRFPVHLEVGLWAQKNLISLGCSLLVTNRSPRARYRAVLRHQIFIKNCLRSLRAASGPLLCLRVLASHCPKAWKRD